MTKLNAVGDVVLTDPAAMRALADSSRLALHDALRRSGPATAGELASLLGTDRRRTLRALEAFEDVGLAERRESGSEGGETSWAAIGKGVFFEIPEEPAGQSAARQLSNAMLLQYADLPRRWVEENESCLTLEWARAAGLLHVGLVVSADELRAIQAAFEAVLEPYLTRRADDVPAGAARVRLLGYFMPEPSNAGERRRERRDSNPRPPA